MDRYVVTYRFNRKVANKDFLTAVDAINFFYTSGFHCYSIYKVDSYGKISIYYF